MFKKILIVVAALLAVLAIVGVFLPRQWHVVRTIDIAVPAAAIHPFVDDLHKWADWAAWNKAMDPDVKWTYAGPERGVGASWAWDGPKMGRGKMTITKSDAAKGVWVDECIEGDAVNAHGSVEFTEANGNTKVTWTDSGTLPPVVVGYFVGMINSMLTENFDVGLKGLKTLAEKGAGGK